MTLISLGDLVYIYFDQLFNKRCPRYPSGLYFLGFNWVSHVVTLFSDEYGGSFILAKKKFKKKKKKILETEFWVN